MTDSAIVWFRRDLRVHDHPSLTAAAGGARAGRRPQQERERATARYRAVSAP